MRVFKVTLCLIICGFMTLQNVQGANWDLIKNNKDPTHTKYIAEIERLSMTGEFDLMKTVLIPSNAAFGSSADYIAMTDADKKNCLLQLMVKPLSYDKNMLMNNLLPKEVMQAPIGSRVKDIYLIFSRNKTDFYVNDGKITDDKRQGTFVFWTISKVLTRIEGLFFYSSGATSYLKLKGGLMLNSLIDSIRGFNANDDLLKKLDQQTIGTFFLPSDKEQEPIAKYLNPALEELKKNYTQVKEVVANHILFNHLICEDFTEYGKNYTTADGQSKVMFTKKDGKVMIKSGDFEVFLRDSDIFLKDGVVNIINRFLFLFMTSYMEVMTNEKTNKEFYMVFGKATEFGKVLNNTNNSMTFFAPSDDSLRGNQLFIELKNKPAELTKALESALVEESLSMEQLKEKAKKKESLQTANSAVRLKLSLDGEEHVMLNDGQRDFTIQSAVKTVNGYVYIIDQMIGVGTKTIWDTIRDFNDLSMMMELFDKAGYMDILKQDNPTPKRLVLVPTEAALTEAKLRKEVKELLDKKDSKDAKDVKNLKLFCSLYILEREGTDKKIPEIRPGMAATKFAALSTEGEKAKRIIELETGSSSMNVIVKYKANSPSIVTPYMNVSGSAMARLGGILWDDNIKVGATTGAAGIQLSTTLAASIVFLLVKFWW